MAEPLLEFSRNLLLNAEPCPKLVLAPSTKRALSTPEPPRNLPAKSLIAEPGPRPKAFSETGIAVGQKSEQHGVLRSFWTLRWSAAFGGPRQTNLESMQVNMNSRNPRWNPESAGLQVRNPNLQFAGIHFQV